MRYRLRTLLISVAFIAMCLAYVGSYVSRSRRGRYEPKTLGLNHVKWYGWAPDGFVEDDEWQPSIMRFYYPVYSLDKRFWHKPLQGNQPTSYSINQGSPDDVWKYYYPARRGK